MTEQQIVELLRVVADSERHKMQRIEAANAIIAAFNKLQAKGK